MKFLLEFNEFMNDSFPDNVITIIFNEWHVKVNI